jgi:hypothetical protein
MRRTIFAAIAAVAVVVSGVTVALALEATTGTGLTNQGAALGFNAKADLSGHINYNRTRLGESMDLDCKEITGYRRLRNTPKGYLRTNVQAICTDGHGKDTRTVYFEAYFVDAGEPGFNDKARICVSTDEAWWDDACSDPNVELVDRGKIQRGNIQIHTDEDPETLMVGDLES